MTCVYVCVCSVYMCLHAHVWGYTHATVHMWSQDKLGCQSLHYYGNLLCLFFYLFCGTGSWTQSLFMCVRQTLYKSSVYSPILSYPENNFIKNGSIQRQTILMMLDIHKWWWENNFHIMIPGLRKFRIYRLFFHIDSKVLVK